MSLKRKASFSSYQSHNGARPVDNTPQHLNSRTRKRFRDNRPDEQTVWEKTLRMLYDAQKRPIVAGPETDEQMSFTPPPCDLEAPDPRQQTLRRFFQPVPMPSSSVNVSGTVEANLTNDTKSQFSTAQGQDPEFSHSGASSGSSTPLSAGSEIDANINANTGFMIQGKCAGGIGWM